MRRTRALLIAISALACLAGEAHVFRAPQHLSELFGGYYRGDGTGYNVTLILNPDRSYSAIWRGCLGKYGTSSGEWSLEDGRVLLRPTEEAGMLQGHLRQLLVGYKSGVLFLIPYPIEDYFQRYGPDRYSAFSRTESPLAE